MVFLAQSDDEGAGSGLLGLSAGAGVGGEEESGLGVVAEAVAQDAERAWGVAEGAGDLLGGAALDEDRSYQSIYFGSFSSAMLSPESRG